MQSWLKLSCGGVLHGWGLRNYHALKNVSHSLCWDCKQTDHRLILLPKLQNYQALFHPQNYGRKFLLIFLDDLNACKHWYSSKFLRDMSTLSTPNVISLDHQPSSDLVILSADFPCGLRLHQDGQLSTPWSLRPGAIHWWRWDLEAMAVLCWHQKRLQHLLWTRKLWRIHHERWQYHLHHRILQSGPSGRGRGWRTTYSLCSLPMLSMTIHLFLTYPRL